MKIARFMATPAGRLIRIALGIVLIWIGIVMDKPAGYVLELIGLVPIAAGILNVCLLAPLLNAPFYGRDAK